MILALLAQSALDHVQSLDANLAILAPVVILISSLILPADATETVKKVVPLVVSTVVTVLTFLATEFPGVSDTEAVVNVLGNIVMVTGLAVSFYKSLSGLLAPLLGGSLNERTGPGISALPREIV